MSNGSNRGSRDYDEYSRSEQSGSFRVTISDEDYEESDYGDRARQRRTRSPQRYQQRQSRPSAERRRSEYPQRSRQGSYAEPGTPRMMKTRTVMTRTGDRFEIPEETALPPKIMRRISKNTRSRGCVVALVYAAIVCSISALLSFYMIVGLNDMLGLDKENAEIVLDVPKGADLDYVTDLLDRNGIVEYPFFFKLYCSLTNDNTFKQGTFTINIKSDYKKIIQKLTRPSTADKSIVTVTIPEGLTIEQIGSLLEEYCVCEKKAFLYSVQNAEFKQAFVANIPNNEKRIYRLEGYLFPDTYQFYIWEGSKAAINKLLNNYKAKVVDNADLNLDARLKKLKRNVDEIITLASIIERESPDKEEMKNVASVFYNRINHPKTQGTGGKLQSDATRSYPFSTIAELRASTEVSESVKSTWINDHKGVFTRKITNPSDGTVTTTEMDTSVYDTYVVTGIPIGPICCPGINSITAALNPNSTDYYFFYITPDGKHYYARTYSDFENVVAGAR